MSRTLLEGERKEFIVDMSRLQEVDLAFHFLILVLFYFLIYFHFSIFRTLGLGLE